MSTNVRRPEDFTASPFFPGNDFRFSSINCVEVTSTESNFNFRLPLSSIFMDYGHSFSSNLVKLPGKGLEVFLVGFAVSHNIVEDW
jgi:hypothetical protein